MEFLKRAKAAQRSVFSKTCNRMEELLGSEEKDLKEIEVTLHLLRQKADKLEEIHEKYLSSLLDETEFLLEYENVEQYRSKTVTISFNAQMVLNEYGKLKNDTALNRDNDPERNVDSNFGLKQRLPEIELQKFDGNLRNWLKFWTQFSKIHESRNLSLGDKFHYLAQCMVSGSEAQEIVESYPATCENYPLVIESLKERFGREDVLIEVYVRDLLSLVLNNAGKKKDNTLGALYNKLSSQLRALGTLGVTSEKCAIILYPIIESTLPEENLRAWERVRGRLLEEAASKTSEGGNSGQQLDALLMFLKAEVQSEERIQLAKTGLRAEPKASGHLATRQNKQEIATAAELFASERNSRSCIFCRDNKSHDSKSCRKALQMSLNEKSLIIKKNGLCFVCLSKGHFAKACRMNVTCYNCSGKHFKVMCPEINKCEIQGAQKNDVSQNSEKDNVLSAQIHASPVQMQTLVVKLLHGDRKEVVRLLIDTGSQRSYLDKNLASKIGLTPIGEESIIHSLFGGVQSEAKLHKSYNIRLCDMDETYRCTFKVIDQDTICAPITKVKRGPWISELRSQGIEISDFSNSRSKIEMLIGADIAGKLMTGKIKHLKSGLVAIETHLGWTLMGKIPSSVLPKNDAATVSSMFVKNAEVADLWKLETIGIRDPAEMKSREENEHITHERFKQTLAVNEEGRYEVALPWIEGRPELPNNRGLAERRLRSATKKLVDQQRFHDYDSVFREWLREGIIEEVLEDQDNQSCLYLPHRAVIKEGNSTTKVRPVFDASAKIEGNPSLNECLEKGPNLIELIPSILTRFRLGEIGVTSDIRKAFLQISIKEEDRDFLRFLWWNEHDPKRTRIFRHNRVVFGLVSSPFLLGATVKHHLETISGKLADTAQQLKDSFYVDNCVSSVNSPDELNKFVTEATEILETAKFQLHSWGSNFKSDSEVNVLNHGSVSVLGLLWNLQEDTLQCDLGNLLEVEEPPVTKRKILAVSHRVFDPIGMTCPVVLYPKLLLKEIWKLKLGWDDELPPDITKRYITWRSTILVLQNLKIPRWIMQKQCNLRNISLHVFNDASSIAYASCIFLRCETETGVYVQLVQAKSRISPLKQVSIPRLELIACTMGARLACTVKKDMRMDDITTHYWTDSTNALCWIQSNERWKVFVSNRVKEIREKSDAACWKYVPGIMNPADLPSRGCSAGALLESRWWEGPTWLKQPEPTWPNQRIKYERHIVNKEKVLVNISGIVPEKDKLWYCRYFSKYPKMIRMIAYMYRFVNNSRNSFDVRTKGELSSCETEKAELSLMKLVQESFAKDDKALNNLNVITDGSGIMRLKTRIILREDKFDFKFPIILPSRHPVVEALITHFHRVHCHCGVQILMTNLRERFWIIRARKTIRRVLRSCVKCRRYNAERTAVITAPLPIDRVRDAALFEITGIDLAGPLVLKGGSKAWIVIFTCAVYRATHLELLTSLSTSAFLQCFRRFVARRGRPRTVYSDNGTNFTGAENAFSKLDYREISEYASVERIQWHFIPPTAAWWGGWWERLIRIVKDLLRRVLGRASLMYEELLTIICDCERVINSRPLTYVSEDPDDLFPLTPATFLQEIPETGVPEIDYLDSKSFGKRYSYCQTLRDNLKGRFRKEYLSQLVDVSHSKRQSLPLREGELVLVGSDNMKRIYWPLGRVIKLYPGKDGFSRVALVKTMKGELTRPIQRLYRLEVASTEEAEALLKTITPGNTPEQGRSRRPVRPPDRLQVGLSSVGVVPQLQGGRNVETI